MGVTKYMPFGIVLAHCVSENVHYDHNPKPLCDVVEKFQNFVKIMKSYLHVYNVKNDNVTGFKLS